MRWRCFGAMGVLILDVDHVPRAPRMCLLSLSAVTPGGGCWAGAASRPVLSPQGDTRSFLMAPRGQAQHARETGDVEGSGSATKHVLSPAEDGVQALLGL